MIELKPIIEKFEAEVNCKVYYGILSQYTDGKNACTSEQFIWKQIGERNSSFEEGIQTAYVLDIDEECGELGSIGVKMAMGGSVRTA